MTKVPVYGLDGHAAGEAVLPPAFAEAVREDLIARAAMADASQYFQPQGNDVWAGMETSARYRGRKEDFGSIKNKGISRLPREVLSKGRFGRVRRIPSSVKGRRAHPPRVEKKLVEYINKKEYAKALRSALAASADSAQVKKRGHILPAGLKLPIVLNADVEGMSKTRQAENLLRAIGLSADLSRSKITRPRTGVGARKGGVKRARSVLIVVGKSGCALSRSMRNIAGVDVASADHLRVLDLAPGAHAGRLTAYTQTALDALAKRKAE